jgi:hypothetical protein
MGREAKTEYADARERVHVRAHLDTQAVELSGGKKLTVPFAAIRAATVEGDDLKIVAAGARFALRLGAKEAALWAKKILNPPSLADKLGIKADKRVVLIGAVPAEIADAAKAAKATTAAAKPPKAFAADIAIVMLAPGREEVLIAAAAKPLVAPHALWFVYEKGRAVNGDDVIALARKAGLKDTKVARVSDTHAALRFVSGK